MSAYLPFGQNADGELIHIEQVQRGKSSLVCPYCGVKLLARKGDILSPHFAHDGQTCRPVDSLNPAFQLPGYETFDLGLDASTIKTLKRVYDEHDISEYSIKQLAQKGLVKRAWNGRYMFEMILLTHLGKIPFGALSLNLFNGLHERMLRVKHRLLTERAFENEGETNEKTAATDLKIYRAQLRRVLTTSLYFIEVDAGIRGMFYKVGVTARPIEQRVKEIGADLKPHLGDGIKLKVLGTWPNRGTTERYFKFRYAKYQHKFGSLTEYFQIANPDLKESDDEKPMTRKRVLLDLRRMTHKALDIVEQALIEGRAFDQVVDDFIWRDKSYQELEIEDDDGY